MSDLVREPSDDEFSRLMDERAPGRLSDNAQQPVEDAVVAPPLPTETDPVEAEQELEPGEVELPDKYQGKSASEIARMHQELEQRLGQQGQELGQLRAVAGELEQVKQYLAAQESQRQQVAPPAPWETPAFDGIDEAVMTDPRGTLDWINQHQPHLYDRAIQTWASLDPFSASRYDTQNTLARERQALQQELAAVRQPVVQQTQDALLQRAYMNVANSNPLLGQTAEHIPAVLEENPELKVVLQNGDLATKERVLNNLAVLASQRAAAQTTPQQTAADAAHAAKAAASVVTGSAGADRPSTGQTAKSDWKQQFVASEGTSIADELARNRAAAIKAGMRRA